MSWPFDFSQTIIFSTLLTTLIVAIGTLILASETKRMRMAQTEPEVFITFQPQEVDIKIIDLIIGNAGQGTAFNIKFKLDPDFEYEKGEYLSELSFIKKGLPFLAPNQNLKTFLMWLEDVDRAIPFDKLAKPFDIMIDYEDITGKTFKRVYPMDLTPLASIKKITERK
jgi:hypothetical protein